MREIFEWHVDGSWSAKPWFAWKLALHVEPVDERLCHLMITRDSLPVLCKSTWAARRSSVFPMRWRDRTLNGQDNNLRRPYLLLLSSSGFWLMHLVLGAAAQVSDSHGGLEYQSWRLYGYHKPAVTAMDQRFM